MCLHRTQQAYTPYNLNCCIKDVIHTMWQMYVLCHVPSIWLDCTSKAFVIISHVTDSMQLKKTITVSECF